MIEATADAGERTAPWAYGTIRPLPDAAPGLPAHPVCRVYTVRGELDAQALRTAWRAVVQRHEALRTAPAAGPDTGPPIPAARLGIVRLGAGEHQVTLRLHQAVTDERSMAVLTRELSAYYAAVAHARPLPAELTAPARPYPDLTARLRGEPTSPAHRELLDWWTAHLTPLPEPLALPAAPPRSAVAPDRGGVVRFDWGRDTAARLAALCRAERTTPYIVLLAAYQTLLCRLGRTTAATVGVPATLRPAGEGYADAVGPFRNHLVLRADLTGRPSFRDLLRRVARRVRDAFDHRELPFAQLVEALGADPRHRPYGTPLCDALFVFEDAPESELRLPRLTVTRRPPRESTVRADLTLTVRREDASVGGSLEYRAALFDRASALAVADKLRTLLTAALDDPGAPVDSLPLTRRSRAAALAPVHEQVRALAVAVPDAVAVDTGGSRVTYAGLQSRAVAIARELRATGAGAGSGVALRMSGGPDRAAALLGVFAAGAYAICLGTGKAGDRDRDALAAAAPVCLIVDPGQSDDALASWYRDALGGRVVDPGALPVPAGGAARSASLAEAGGRWAYLTHTSGSTGVPKGIPQTHRTLAQFTDWFTEEFRIGPGSRVAGWASPGYDAGLVETFAALAAGATLCPVPDRIRAHPEKLAAWLAAERITHFQTVPSFARTLLGAITADGPRPAALDCLLLAGEPLPGELANGLRAALPGVRLINLYGATETILATWHEITGPEAGTVPAGRAIPGRRILVLDENDRPCPPGTTGSIVVRSPYITPGYAGGGAPHDDAFRPVTVLAAGNPAPDDRFYRSGDLGRRRPDGVLEFAGRGDARIKFYGVRMELTDIEAALTAHPSVADCAVTAHTGDDGLVSRLVAHVVPGPTPEGEPDGAPAVWRAVLRRRFGTSIPVAFRTLTALPRNAGGKIDRRSLAAPQQVPG
ncbi:AMP-binding protein [Streptomyces jumonjinensis]|uniref:AMP-binding protein n=1 Tax=Streptomyces jumonjinensis TaxID=1945 RepID=UPI00379FCF15